MKPLVKIVFLATSLFLGRTLQADALPETKPYTLSVRQIIVKQAVVYNVQPEKLLRVAKCESGLNPRALNKMDTDGLPAFGLFQYKKGTWERYSNLAGIPNADIWNAEHQAQTTAYAFSTGKSSAWGCK